MVDPVHDDHLAAARVRRRYGISDMTLWRWLADARIAFPRPIYIGRRRYWRLADLTAWEAMRRGEMPAGNAIELSQAS